MGRCFWFTFSVSEGICVEMEDCPAMFPCSNCTSSQQECSSQEGDSWDKIFVGIGKEEFELIDVSNSSGGDCSLPNYPFPIEYPATMAFDPQANLVRSCGGHVPSVRHTTPFSNLCFTFDGFQWKEDKTPPTDGFYKGYSVMVPEVGWWLIACKSGAVTGCHEDSKVFSQNNTWIEGPHTPPYNYSSSSHYTFPVNSCIVQLNSSHTMILGGRIQDNTIADVWIYDWSKEIWVKGPDMISPRREHSCALLSGDRVIVAGGKSLYGEDIISMEVFDSGFNIWYASQDLPEDDKESHNQILEWNDDLLWINWPGNLWKFEIDTWSLLREIDSPNFGNFAFTVPNDFVPGCANEK